MDVSPLVWGLTIVGIIGLLAFDFFFHVRHAHVPTLKEAAIWSALYVGIAIVFGFGVLIFGGGQMGSEYFAGYITEKALSVDNLFVFLIIMASFKVPREDQQKVLLFGIVFALIARTSFILAGAALINQFAWIFYLFGLVLLLTAGNLLKGEDEEEGAADNFVIRMARKVFHTSEHYDGDKMFTIENNLPFINDGEHVPVVEVGIGLSLTVILGVLLVTVLASLMSPAGKAHAVVAAARRHATAYLDADYTQDPNERERLYRALLEGQKHIEALPEKYQEKARDEAPLVDLMARAHDEHNKAIDRGEATPQD